MFEVFESGCGNVSKYVFTGSDYVAETVLYKYGDYYKRTVICCSTQSGCPVGCKFCFPSGTKILMNDFTYKNIEDITVGDIVVGNKLTLASNGFSDYSSLQSKDTEVKTIFKREYNGKLIALKTKSGKSIKATTEHPIAVKNDKIFRSKFIPIKDINVGDVVITCDKFDVENRLSKDWRVGWLYGFICGDGTYTKRKNRNCYRWSVSQSNSEIINIADDICNKYGIRHTKIWTQCDGVNKVNFRFEIGEQGTKTLMELVKTHKDSIVYKKGYLAGFWDAEGFSFNNNKSVRVCNNDKLLLLLFGEYLADLGYSSKIKNYGLRKNMVLDTNFPRNKFLQLCTPYHEKKNYLNNKITRSLVDFDEVISIEVEEYCDYVYNIETTEKTYIANDILVHNCGTGNKFIRNLTENEIVSQIITVLNDKGIQDINSKGERFQIMFMSMGEPMLNWENVSKAILRLGRDFPNAELLLSTIAPCEPVAFSELLNFSKFNDKIGLQFSIHKSTDEKRNILIPYKNKYTLEQIRDYGLIWWKETGRNPYLNYCIDGSNNTQEDIENLKKLFSPCVFKFTFSVVCSPDENMKETGYKNLDIIRDFESKFIDAGYNTRIFNPDAQDTIGAGCGQLWYVQQWMKEHEV